MAKTNNIIYLFAQDILNYQRMGGDMNNLTAQNVYNLINNQEHVEKPAFDEHAFEDNLIRENDLEHINKLYAEASSLLEPLFLKYIFKKMKTNTSNFDELTTRDKIIYLTHAYRLISYDDKPVTWNNNNNNSNTQSVATI